MEFVKSTSRAAAIAVLVLLVSHSTGLAQMHQSKLYIDNGSGQFLQLITNTLTSRSVNVPDPGVNGANILYSATASGQSITGGLTVDGLIIPNGGSLTIQNGGALNVQSGGTLTVQNGGTLQVT